MGDGNLHFAISAGEDESAHHDVNVCVYEPLRPIGGSVSAEHGVGLEKEALSRCFAKRYRSPIDENIEIRA